MKKNQRGFTMGEVLLVTSLFTFASTGVMTLLHKKSKTNAGEQYYRQMVMDGRNTVEQIARELRQAGADSAQPSAAIVVANGEQIVFETDLDGNGSTERIEYRLKGGNLERGVVTKQADGSLPPVKYEVVAERVDNGGLPVFTFDGDISGEQPIAADPRQVRVMLLLRSPVRDRRSGRARTVGFEAVAQRRSTAPAESAGSLPAPQEPAAEPASPAVETATEPVSAPAPASMADAVSQPAPSGEPAAKLFSPVPVRLGVPAADEFPRVRFPRRLHLPAMFPAIVVIATTAGEGANTNTL